MNKKIIASASDNEQISFVVWRKYKH